MHLSFYIFIIVLYYFFIPIYVFIFFIFFYNFLVLLFGIITYRFIPLIQCIIQWNVYAGMLYCMEAHSNAASHCAEE